MQRLIACSSRRCAAQSAACVLPACLAATSMDLARRTLSSRASPLWRGPHPPASEPSGGTVDATEETHPDFQPRAVATDVAAEEVAMIQKDIDDTVRDEKVVIFIKGVPEAPMCAYSKKMVDVMECLGLEYTSFDVLAHPVVRSYVKVKSEWPTIPQLFLCGEFAGGLDVVLQMAQAGDLQILLDSKGIKHRDQKL
eukprot:gene10765-7493_t